MSIRIEKHGYLIIERSAYLIKVNGNNYNTERILISSTYNSDIKDGDNHLFVTQIIVPILESSIVYLYPISFVVENIFGGKPINVSVNEIFSITIFDEEFIPKPILNTVKELQKRIKTPNIKDIIPSIPEERKDKMIKACIIEEQKNNGNSNGLTV